jgi:Neuraminidase (sialidase)
MRVINEYYLKPKGTQKSFGGKAVVKEYENGDKVLISYLTPVLKETKEGKLIRLWDGHSATTGRHVESFAGITASYFKNMIVQVEEEEE